MSAWSEVGGYRDRLICLVQGHRPIPHPVFPWDFCERCRGRLS